MSLDGAANAGAIRATIDFDAGGLQRAVSKAMDKATFQIKKSIDTSMNEVEHRVEGGFRSLGHKIIGFLGIEDITAAVNQGARAIIHLGTSYESSLNTFQAVSNATEAQMKQIGATAQELGNDLDLPGTSAADAADAMTELAKSGFDVQQSMQAAKGSLQLATAAQTDAATAAHIQAEAINSFNLKATDALHVADLLSNAANLSAANIDDLAYALQQSGAVAHASGISLDETTAALALMANNAQVGSDAGTSLKTMLVSLQAPSTKAQKLMQQYGISVYDTNGNLKSLSGIVETLTKGTAGLTQQQKQYVLATIFGTDAIRAVNVLMHEGADGITEMTKGLGKQGAAAKLAAANSKGLVGSLNALQSEAETLALQFYEKVSPAIDQFIRGRLDQLPGFLSETEHYLGEVTDSLAPAADLLREFISAATPGALEAFKAALAAGLGVLQALELVLRPVDELIQDNETAFRELVGPIVAATVAYKVLTSVVSQSKKAWNSDRIVKTRVAMIDLKSSMKSASGVAASFRRVGGGLVGAMGGPWGIAIAGAATAIGIFAAKHAEAKAKVDALRDSLNQETGAITKNTRATIAKRLEDEGLLEAANKVGLATSTLVDAALGQVDANHQIAESYVAVFNAASGLDDHARETVGKLLPEWNKIRDGLHGIRGDVDDAKASQERLITATEGVVRGNKPFMRQLTEVSRYTDRAQVSTNRFEGATRQSANALDKDAEAADGAKKAIRGLRDETIKGLNAQIDFQDSADNLRKTIKNLTPEEIKSGHALDIHYQVGRDVARNMIDLAQNSAKVKGGMAQAREQIIKSYEALGVSKQKAKDLTDQFFDLSVQVNKVPDAKTIDVHANTKAARLALEGLRSRLIELSSVSVTPHIHMPGQAHALGGAVYGPGTGTSDSVVARLSNGEHVFTAQEVRDAGGQENVYAIRAALRRGGLPALAEMASGAGGALVDNLSIAVGAKEDLPDALDETMFHLRRIRRGGRY